jgi:uncharacterized protein (TIGR00730 family)
MKTLRRLCVFCGSNSGDRPAYRAAARLLGETLARHGIGIIYGGTRLGLMGVLADAALSAGGEVIGVIPGSLMAKEVEHKGLTELRIVQSMHERKTLMGELSAGFVALPGGVGTLEEIFEAWTWGQLGYHQKPCALLNIEGFYDRLIDFLNQVAARQFMKDLHRSMLIVADTPLDVLKGMQNYAAPMISKWIERLEN